MSAVANDQNAMVGFTHGLEFDLTGFNGKIKNELLIYHTDNQSYKWPMMCIQNEKLQYSFKITTVLGDKSTSYLYVLFKSQDTKLECYIKIIQGETLNLCGFSENNFNITVLQNEKGQYQDEKLYQFVHRCLNRYVHNDNIECVDINEDDGKYTYKTNNELSLKIEDTTMKLCYDKAWFETTMKPNMKLNLRPLEKYDVNKLTEIDDNDKKQAALEVLFNECMNSSKSQWIFLGKCVAVLAVVLLIGFFVVWKMDSYNE